MTLRSLMLVTIPLLVLLGVEATAAVEIRSLAAGASSPPATVEALAWLQGRWVGEGLGARAEEIYGAPAGGRIMGMFGLVREDEAQFYEFILIEEREGSLVLRLKHFDPDFSPWEAADETVDFPLVALQDGIVWFDGLTLARTGEREMVAAVRTRSADGEDGRIEFRYERADD